RPCASCATRPAASICARSSTSDDENPGESRGFCLCADYTEIVLPLSDLSHVASAGHSPVVSGVLGAAYCRTRTEPGRAGLAAAPPGTAPGHRHLLAALRVPRRAGPLQRPQRRL